MADERIFVKNMPGRNRPRLDCDDLGNAPEIGDEEWESRHKKNYTKLPNGTWERKQ